MIPILVTGGAGYIGSHTAKVLAQNGFQPIVYDNLSLGHRAAVRWGPLIEGDLADARLLRETLRQHKVKAVIHFAGFSYVGESVTAPRKYFHNNAVNTLHLLDAMSDCGVDNIVFSSTCAVYGEPEIIPIPESHPTRPINPYGDSKLFIERMLHAYSQAYGLRWISLRYFNAAGADPAGEIGEDHDPESHLIPLCIFAIQQKIPFLQLFGTDYPTPDGTAIRDYIHVLDLAAAHELAVRNLLDEKGNFVCNLGTGTGCSVREVIAAVERVSGQPVPFKEKGRRAGDPPELVANTQKAYHLWNWRPVYSDLDTIVRTAWNWHAKASLA